MLPGDHKPLHTWISISDLFNVRECHIKLWLTFSERGIALKQYHGQLGSWITNRLSSLFGVRLNGRSGLSCKGKTLLIVWSKGIKSKLMGTGEGRLIMMYTLRRWPPITLLNDSTKKKILGKEIKPPGNEHIRSITDTLLTKALTLNRSQLKGQISQ